MGVAISKFESPRAIRSVSRKGDPFFSSRLEHAFGLVDAYDVEAQLREFEG